MKKVKITKARKSDFADIVRLIKELADFEKLTPPTQTAQKRLLNDAFGKNPQFKIILAKSGKETFAYAFYSFMYSSFYAKPILYLEDIYVTKKYRGFGFGNILFKELVRIAKKNKCISMKWCVLNWNKNAIDFYNKLGAEPISKWIYYRKQL